MSTRTIYVSMTASDWVNDSREFTAKVMDLQTLCARPVQPTVSDPNPLHIVLAPEYFFRMSPAAAVKKMKETYHGRGTQANARMDDQMFAQFQGRRTKNTMYSPREKELLLYHMCMSTRGKNILVIPGTMFWTESEPIVRSRTMRSDQVVSKGVVRNTMWVIYRGNVIKTYHKRKASHELDTFEERLYDFREGANDAAFEAGGLSFVAEVCADHSNRYNAKNYIVSQGNINMTPDEVYMHNKLTVAQKGVHAGEELGVDIHIVVSDGMQLNSGDMAIRKGGFGLNCDASFPCAVKTRHAVTGALTDVVPTSNNYWELTLGQSGARSTAFQDARAAMERNFKPRTM